MPGQFKPQFQNHRRFLSKAAYGQKPPCKPTLELNTGFVNSPAAAFSSRDPIKQNISENIFLAEQDRRLTSETRFETRFETCSEKRKLINNLDWTRNASRCTVRPLNGRSDFVSVLPETPLGFSSEDDPCLAQISRLPRPPMP